MHVGDGFSYKLRGRLTDVMQHTAYSYSTWHLLYLITGRRQCERGEMRASGSFPVLMPFSRAGIAVRYIQIPDGIVLSRVRYQNGTTGWAGEGGRLAGDWLATQGGPARANVTVPWGLARAA